MTRQEEITQLLVEWAEGDTEAFAALLPIVYQELRQMAHAYLQGERTGHTLNTTALVHEAYLKLIKIDRIRWQDRAHFFAMAAQAMRNILVDYAVRRKAKKRGGGQQTVSLEEAEMMTEEHAEELLALDQALKRLADIDERQCRVVECRFFGRLSIEETAAVLGVSPATVSRDWSMARAWLNRELGGA